ncbi:(R)-specific enoyl-CoA hydratase [Dioscorea cayenensis subsp. rotundata]|uniref:(R)-specific enoyl-CoA hydratase n=1 Tax=Dioscorea cayennensis subsp. rotundata TaxID=55577 RepID=A0AB40CE96_DIOCR|nr:(R)-specific enoyl-CoA hydratase [Dioscorea cayenensis subsp. rotundata]XP_039138226.1 (R)-specific enoyl-CoA hydratase [Dioscorea cayenensis subsp. rotundata]
MIRGILIRAAAFCSTAGGTPAAQRRTGILGTGDVLKEMRRFSEADVARFAEVSGDRNPVHFDPDFALSAAGFSGGRIVHGMLVASLFPSIIASHFPGAIYVSQTLQFKLPVYIDDEVVAKVQALSVREHKQRFIVKFTTKCFTNIEQLVIDGEATAILPTLAHNR